MVRPFLLHTDVVDNLAATFQFDGNKSIVDDAQINREQDVDYNIAIRVHLSK